MRGIARARAEVDRRAAPAAPCRRREEALHVHRVGAPLKAMQGDEARAPGRSFDVIEDELVAVGRFKNLADERHLAPRPGQPPPGRLEMRPREPPGGRESRVPAGSRPADQRASTRMEKSKPRKRGGGG